MAAPNWTKVSEKVARQILDQADKHLSAQLQIGLASDQRALGVTSIAVGFASAIYAAAIGYWSSNGDCAILFAGLIAGSIMLVGGFMCAWAARPVNFFCRGNHPERWWGVADQPITALLGGETENYQEMIVDNEKVLNANARWLERGVFLSSLSPLVGVLCWASIALF